MASIITRYVVDDDGRVYCRASARASCGGPQASGCIICSTCQGALWHLTIIVWYSGAVSVSRVERGAVAETGSS